MLEDVEHFNIVLFKMLFQKQYIYNIIELKTINKCCLMFFAFLVDAGLAKGLPSFNFRV